MSDVTKALPERNGSKANGDLVFVAKLPPLGFSTSRSHRAAVVNVRVIHTERLYLCLWLY